MRLVLPEQTSGIPQYNAVVAKKRVYEGDLKSIMGELTKRPRLEELQDGVKNYTKII